MTQSYLNLGGSGPRTSIFDVQRDWTLFGGSARRLVDGDLTAGSGKPIFVNGTVASGKFCSFELNGSPRIVTGYKWYQAAPVSPIQFNFDGWNGTAWVTLSTDTMSGVGGSTPYVASFANTTPYQKYRLIEVGGTWTDSYIIQIEFEISGTDDEIGDRTSSITSTSTFTNYATSTPSNLVDGAYGSNASDAWAPSAATAVSGETINFQFSTPRCVKYAFVETASDATGTSGTWQWQSSDDGSTWTNVGSPVELTYSPYANSKMDLSANTSKHSFYRMLGVSGTIQFKFMYEILFDIEGSPPEQHLAVDIIDGSVLSVELEYGLHFSVALNDDAVMTIDLTAIDNDLGPFYFAWVDADETTFNTAMLREDEEIFSFNISQTEGEFAHLSIVIKNPRVGLLSPSRKIWAWLAYGDGTITRPLFFGRLVGLPSNIFNTLVTLEFLARPNNFATQKAALAETLRVAPYFDPLFVSPDSWDDPDVVLEGYTRFWHTDRITHLLTTSDVVVPEDGVIELTEDDHLYSGLATSMTEVPLRRVRVEATIPWTQTASGDVSLSGRLLAAWGQSYKGKYVKSYTFKGLSADWPKSGGRFGQGWRVKEGSLIDVSGLAVPTELVPQWFDDKALGAVLTMNDTYPLDSIYFQTFFLMGSPAGIEWSNGPSGYIVIPSGWGEPILTISYDSSRNYTETVIIDLEADMQAIMTMPGDDEALVLTINANSASDYSHNGDIPLHAPALSTYSNTPRGEQSIEYLIMMARAALINRSRAVTINCKLRDFKKSFDITLRKGLLIHDHRLPGGQALGKITGYNISYARGVPTAAITINSAVGYGGAVVTDIGEDAYIDDDYIDDYYVRDGVVTALPSSDVTYSVTNYAANDDELDLMRGLNDGVLKSLTVVNGPSQQADAMYNYAGGSDLDAYKIILDQYPTQVHAEITPIGSGPFNTEVHVVVSKLIVPKQINLEAST